MAKKPRFFSGDRVRDYTLNEIFWRRADARRIGSRSTPLAGHGGARYYPAHGSSFIPPSPVRHSGEDDAFSDIPFTQSPRLYDDSQTRTRCLQGVLAVRAHVTHLQALRPSFAGTGPAAQTHLKLLEDEAYNALFHALEKHRADYPDSDPKLEGAWGPMHEAAKLGDTRIIVYLLEKLGIGIDVMSDSGTALHAVLRSNLDFNDRRRTVAFLIERKANPLCEDPNTSQRAISLVEVASPLYTLMRSSQYVNDAVNELRFIV